jgi:hypothetical protein
MLAWKKVQFRRCAMVVGRTGKVGRSGAIGRGVRASLRDAQRSGQLAVSPAEFIIRQAVAMWGSVDTERSADIGRR